MRACAPPCRSSAGTSRSPLRAGACSCGEVRVGARARARSGLWLHHGGQVPARVESKAGMAWSARTHLPIDGG
eukprot:scaffold111575_cov60-Phaeocystis_antarctica.AAC.2